MSMTTTTTNFEQLSQDIQAAIRDVPDYPKPGIVFKDITTVLRDGDLLRRMVEAFTEVLANQKVDYIVGIESRGFILGTALAYNMGIGFVPVRKKGKLPSTVVRHEYDLEYGSDCVEIHIDAVEPGSRVVLIDDLLATGGTCCASATLLSKLDRVELVGILFMIELAFLNGKAQLPNVPVYKALVTY